MSVESMSGVVTTEGRIVRRFRTSAHGELWLNGKVYRQLTSMRG